MAIVLVDFRFCLEAHHVEMSLNSFEMTAASEWIRQPVHQSILHELS